MIINKVTTKFNSLEGRKVLLSTDSSKCLTFMTLTPTPSSAGKGGIVIEEWRKKEIPNRPTVERDGKVWHWCPKYMQPARGFPNGLHVCSHLPKNHDEWERNKKNF